MYPNHKICRTCLSVKDTLFHSLDDTVPNFDLISIKEKISLCAPELSFDSVPDAVICTGCVSDLHTAFVFKRKCLKTEQRIQDYIYNKKCKFSEVDLKKIINSMDNINKDLSDEKPSDLTMGFQKTALMNITGDELQIKNEVLIESTSMDISVVKAEPMDYLSESEETQQNIGTSVKIEVSNKSYICTICDKAYKREIGLIAHMRIHEVNQTNLVKPPNDFSEIKEFLPKQYENFDAICDICEKRFYSKSNLTVHMRIHTGEKPYKCKTCDKAFTQKIYLVAHERTHTGEKPFKCSLCDKSFAQKSYLRTHMIVHTGVRHHICKVCGKGCAHTGDLNNHMRIHTGEKPYKCLECGKCFTQSVHLKSHIKIHSGEKPFECQLCHAKYTEARYLKKHMRVHSSGERPFKCEVCLKTFHERYVLNVHMRSHTGEKPCLCTVCKKTFSKTSHLVEHMRTHTGEKPFSCKVCNTNFAYKQSLNAHLKAHLKNDTEISSVLNKSKLNESEPCTSNNGPCILNHELDIKIEEELSETKQSDSIKTFLDKDIEEHIKGEPKSEHDDED